MATVGNTVLTLTDYAKRLGPDHQISRIIELLSQSNEILDDMMWMEGNLPTGHRTTVRTGLPAVAWRLLNYGVPPTKSKTAQVTDQTGMLEAISKVDQELLNLNGNKASFRLSEDMAFIEAMNQELATTLIYGNSAVEPEKFLGLAPRYSDLSAANAQNIIDAGGTGVDNTSIWLVYWGDNTCHGIYPKGSTGGLSFKDLGPDVVSDGAGGEFVAERTHYKWRAGLTLRDWRYAVRIANIDVSNLVGETSAADLIKLMIRALHRIPNRNVGKAAFYMNRTVREMLDIQATNKTNVQLRIDEFDGKFRTMFRDVPLRTVDAIVNTEDQVV